MRNRLFEELRKHLSGNPDRTLRGFGLDIRQDSNRDNAAVAEFLLQLHELFVGKPSRQSIDMLS